MSEIFKRSGLVILAITGLTLFIVTNRAPQDQINNEAIQGNVQSENRSVPKKQASLQKTEPVLNSKYPSQQWVAVTNPSRIPSRNLGSASERVIYLSNQKAGVIGIQNGQADSPSDNIFSVSVDTMPTANDKVWLSYKLNGIQENAGVSCSVNDRYAFGGYLVKIGSSTNAQRIQLNPSWIHVGENRFQFSVPQVAGYGYGITELSLEVERGAQTSALTVNQASNLYDGKAYVHGFIQGVDASAAHVQLNGKDIVLNDGEFEAILDANTNKQVALTAQIAGQNYRKDLLFKNNIQADTIFALNTKFEKSTKLFEKGKADNLSTSRAELTVSDSSLISTRQLSLSSLRDVDLPALDMNIVNTTDKDQGFRFLPHGNHFIQAATVALKYDRTKIPSGYTEDDIQTFYFDTQTKQWAALERDSVDKTLCMVVSKTTHFTDMINGVIKTPESPESEAFVPTMMNDVKIAEPSAGIQLIAPPTANSNGSANLSYNIELAPILQSVAPNLNIQYNSDGGSGWLGEGWDLNVPSIKVDTRWGVPRYDPKYETETYLLNGTMLTTMVSDATANPSIPNSGLGEKLGVVTVSHKGAMYTRLYDSRTDVNGYEFFPQVEGSFSQIIRKRDTPGTYYWEVSDKNGTKYIYGDSAQNVLKGLSVQTFNRIDTSSVLITTSPIAEWKLSEIIGLHGERCKFIYETKTRTINSGVSSKDIILKQILMYNGAGVCSQTVNFQADSVKKKLQLSARYGFLTSNNSLLNSVEVKTLHSDNKMHKVRNYLFKYSTTNFGSTLLDSIIQYDTASVRVAKHGFVYKKSDKNKLFKPVETWNVNKTVAGLPALGGGKTKSYGSSFFAGIGIGISNVVGAEVLYNRSSNNTESTKMMMMVDVNGDGLPDNLHLNGDDLYFCPNLGNQGSSGNRFGADYKLLGLPSGMSFSYAETNTLGNGVQGDVKVSKNISLNAGWDKSTTWTATKTYFSDVNNDGLIDIVNNGLVYFNKTNIENGVAIPSFITDSRGTLSVVSDTRTKYNSGAPILPPLDNPSGLSDDDLEQFDQTPMQDIVRVWEAPEDGLVTLTDSITKLQCVDTTKQDGLIVSVSRSYNDAIVWSLPIQENDYSLHVKNYSNKTMQNGLFLSKGEKLYYRLQSGNLRTSLSNGDIVSWKSTIRYENTTTSPLKNLAPETGYNQYVFKSSDGYFVSKQGYNLVDSALTIDMKVKFKKEVENTNSTIYLKLYVSNDSLLYRDSLVQSPDPTDPSTILQDHYKIAYNNSIYHPKSLVWQDSIGPNDAIDLDYVERIPTNLILKGPNHFWFEMYSKTNEQWNKLKWQPELHVHNIGKDTVIYCGVKYGIYSKCVNNGQLFTEIIPTIPVADNHNGVFLKLDLWNDSYINPYPQVKHHSSISAMAYTGNGRLMAVSNGLTDSVYGAYIPSLIIDDIYRSECNANGIFVKLLIDNYLNLEPLSSSVYFKCAIDSAYNSSRNQFVFKETGQKIYPAVYRKRSDNEQDFGPMWRGWGQFEYNASNNRYLRPIETDSLFIPQDTTNLKIDKMAMFNMTPDFVKKRYWRGVNEHIFIKGDTMCTGRLNVKNMPNVVDYTNVGGGPLTSPVKNNLGNVIRKSPKEVNTEEDKYTIKNAPILRTKCESNTFWGGATLSGLPKSKLSIGASGSISSGKGWTTSAYMDMNGDGYPDRISEKVIEYTNARGGRDGEKDNEFNTEENKSSSFSVGLSGGYGISIPSTNNMKFTSKISANLSYDVSGSVGLSYSDNSDHSTCAYIDVNGDGLPDRLFAENDNTVKVSLNLGYAFTDKMDWGLTTIGGGSNHGYSVSASGAASTLVYEGLSTVKDVIDKFNILSFGAGLNSAYSVSKTLYGLRDLNADGLIDKLYLDKYGIFYVSYNLGSTFSKPDTLTSENSFREVLSNSSLTTSANINAKLTIPMWFLRLIVGGSLHYGWSTDYTLSDIQDIDGDGYPDLVSIKGEPLNPLMNNFDELNVRRSTIGCVDKLLSVTNSLGGKFTIGYEKTMANFDHPGGKWVMISDTIIPGVAVCEPNVINKYEYTNANYNRNIKEFLGFGKVTTYNMDTKTNPAVAFRKTLQEFDVSNYYVKGNLLNVVISDANNKKYNVSTNIYYKYAVNRLTECAGDLARMGSIFIRPTTLSADSVRDMPFIVYSPQQYSKNVKHEYSTGSHDSLITAETFMTYYRQFDSGKTHGELLMYKISDKGTLGEYGSGAYNYKTEIRYANSDFLFNKYICGLPKKVTVTGGDNKIYRLDTAKWDTQKNELIQTVRLVAPLGTTQLNATNAAVTNFQYDLYGNITKKTLPKNNNGKRQAYEYTYDPFHLYLTQVKDSAFGYVSTLGDYDYKFGVPRTTTDINGNQKKVLLDNVGRVTHIWGPNEVARNSKYTINFEYKPAVLSAGVITSPAYAITRHFDDSQVSPITDQDIETIAFADGFGKIVQTKKEGVVNGTAKMIVDGMSIYDAFGRVIEKHFPVEEAFSNKLITNMTPDSYKTVYTYDILDRTTKVKLPDGKENSMVYAIESGLSKTTASDALNNKQITYTDGSGQTVKTIQSPDSVPLNTQFEYNSINELTKVTDAMGGKTESVYDMGGRRLQVKHPASGTTNFTYDLAGNLISKTTANLLLKNLSINYLYDFNRLSKIQYPEHPENNVSNYYGNNITATDSVTRNRRGRLVTVVDASGAQEYIYGRMGEVISTRRTLIVPNQLTAATSLTTSTYDSWNRIRSMTYPSGFVVTYKYDLGGMLSGVYNGTTGYVKDIKYDKFEREISLGNGDSLKTNNSYTIATGRLNNAYLSNLQGSNKFMNNTYSYDAVGNILSISNTPNYFNSDINGTTYHFYSYDKLYRLTHAKGQFSRTTTNTKIAQYKLDMAYDNLHNIASKDEMMTQTNLQFAGTLNTGYNLKYNYNTDNHQQIACIVDSSYRTEGAIAKQGKLQTYLYDANGNLLCINNAITNKKNLKEIKNQRRMLWDEENRLLSVSDNGFVSNYWYDASGERTVKEWGESEAVAVNGQSTGAKTGNKKFSIYCSPYFVINSNGECSDHIYIGSKRMASVLYSVTTLTGLTTATNATTPDSGTVNYSSKYSTLTAKIKTRYDSLGIVYRGFYNRSTPFTSIKTITGRTPYLYHSDHLGSSSLITSFGGQILQNVQYMPFGEVLVDQNIKTWDMPYKFNGKALDEETGLYYYGARYYDPRTSVWLGVDPLAEKYPNSSAYVYCLNNPVKYVDPDGRDVTRSPLFKKSPYGQAFQNLRQNNSVFKQCIGKYENNKNYNLKLSINNSFVLSKGGAAVTDMLINKVSAPKMLDTNSNFLFTNVAPSDPNYSFTDIGVVLVVAHEAIHQNLALSPLNEDQAHNTYNSRRDMLANILKEYVNDNSINTISNADITALSFSGQQDSNAFRSYIKEMANQNHTTYNKAKAQYDALITNLIYKKNEKSSGDK